MSGETLPASWCETSLEELVKPSAPILYGILQPGPNIPDGVPYVRPTEISEDRIQLGALRKTTAEIAAKYSRSTLATNDIVMSMVGTIGKVALVPDVLAGGNITQSSVRIRSDEKVISHGYLAWFLRSPNMIRQFEAKRLGTAVPRLNVADIRELKVSVPPLTEQKRIVAKIEELFSELEAGEASLRQARRQLGVYRQSLLKQAFEGKLTQKWRTQNPAKLESPVALLKSAADNRRDQWKGRGRYQDAIGPKLNAERPIPECWAYASLDQITLNFDGQRVPLKREDRDKRSGAYPYYGASGIIDDIDDFLFDGDYLLIAEDGANLLSRSTPIAFQAHGKFWVNNHAHIVQPVSAMLMRYLELFLNGRDLTRFISGTAQPKLNQANLNQVPVPLCSLPEQQEIVRVLDEQFEAIERNERELDAALQRSEALRQSILKKAFTGRLVPQDPSDEPASQLLARLRAAVPPPKSGVA
ncbi:MAG: restriction endonuclease subunit S [Opitutaceae bacterium]|nr:restriction endonuclease subunit S [Opitutaceae bacterium]